MKTSIWQGISLMLALCCLFCTQASLSKVIVYSIPDGVEQNNTFTMKIRPLDGDWINVDIYNVEVRTAWAGKTNASMVYFDSDEPVEIELTINNFYINNAVIRPVRRHISYEKTGPSTMRFILNEPAKISVEINNMIYNNLHIFYRLPEENPINEGGESITYFGPGYHLISDQVLLNSNHTYYIAGGAFVEVDVSSRPSAISHVLATQKNDISIKGRGVLFFPGPSFGDVRDSQGIRIVGSSRILIEGINIIKQSRGWTLNICHNCRNIVIQDLGIISVGRNGDGIDIVGSQSVVVRDCFVRAPDDALCVKAWTGDQRTEDILFQDCVVWNDITSHPLEIGFELRSPTVRNITFRNIDIIHSNNTLNDMGTISISHGDHARLHNVLYENIYIENIHSSRLRVVDFQILYHPTWSLYSGSNNRGTASDITLRNLFYNGNRASIINGYDADHKISNVLFENFYYNKKLVLSSQEANLTEGVFTDNILYRKARGLVAHWNFNEVRGDIIYDSSPFDNYGVIVDAQRVPGQSDKSMLFDGAKKATINAHPVMDLSDGQFTIHVELFFDDKFSGKQGIIGCETIDENNRYPSIFILDGSDIEFGFGTGTTYSHQIIRDVINPGQWHKLTYVLNADNSTEMFFVNGVVKYHGNNDNKPFAHYSLNIGGAGSYYWNGLIDKVKIYNLAMNTNEVNALIDGLVGFWPLDDTKGTLAIDSSVHQNHGMLTKEVWTTDGVIGGAAIFDGTVGINIDGNNALDISDGNFTISLWGFFDEKFNGTRGLIGHQSESFADRYPGVSIVNGSDIHFGFGTGTSYSGQNIPNVVESGQWYHFVYTLNQHDQTERFFLNGEEVYFQKRFDKPILKTRINIGMIGTSGWVGKIDDVRVYNRALSKEEIMGLTMLGDITGYGEIMEIPDTSFRLFPNPTSGVFSINPQDDKKYQLKVFNTGGICLISKEISGLGEIDMTAYSKGVYYVVIRGNNVQRTQILVLI